MKTESKPSILEYVMVLFMVLVTTVGLLFKQKKEKEQYTDE